MSEHFELNISDTDGQPALYLHGLGSPDPIGEETERVVNDLGFSLSNQWRRGEAEILQSDNPVELYTQGLREAIDAIAQKSGEKVTLIGNSLGSYLSMLGALYTTDRIHGVLGIDAYLMPAHSLATFERHYPVDAKSGLYECELVNNRTIQLPKGLGAKLPDIATLHKQRPVVVPFPIKMFWGNKDWFQTEENLRELSDRISKFDYHAMPGLGHIDWKEAPDQQALMLEFLASLITS